MAYDINWLDRDRNIVAVRLFDPFPTEEAKALKDEMMPYADNGQPMYILLDIREFNPMKALATFGGRDGPAMPKLDPEQARRSRLALVGAGSMVNLLLKMTDDDSEQVRVFKHEDKAYRWLTEEASGGAADDGGAGFG